MPTSAKFRPLRLALAVLLLSLASTYANAGDVDIIADKIVRDAKGLVTATGHVEINRAGETLRADKVRYDTDSKQIYADGNVHIHSANADITAASGTMNSENKIGELWDATILLPGGEHLRANRVQRLNEYTYRTFQPVLSTCPKDQETWHVYASEGVLDQSEGTFTAKNARFEFAGVPLFYTPYWQQATRRKSGFMIPSFAFGKRRGTEWTLPYYFAPAPDWDATITPRLMTARGFMLENEFRHVSTVGREQVQFDGLYDRLVGKTRGYLEGEGSWRLPLDLNLSVKGREVSDIDYLADFSRDTAQSSLRYLSSSAVLSQALEYGSWSLSSIYSHNLSTVNNKATLQQYPNFNGNLSLPLFDSPATLHFDQNTTRFSNRIGVNDWRVYSHSYVTLPWTMFGGGVSNTITTGLTHTRYWLRQGTIRKPRLTSGEFSFDSSLTFERINSQRTFRHSIIPHIRYDFNNVSNRPGVPTFDSGLSPLRLSNLFSGNRFSGFDAVENSHRIAFLLSNNFENKATPEDTARTVLSINAGLQYNIRSQFNALNPPRAFSNLLGDMSFNPIKEFTAKIEGEYDPTRSFWNRIAESITWDSGFGHQISATYLVSNSELATTSEIFQASGATKISERWKAEGSINYDIIQQLTQQISVAFTYTHPCWEIIIQGHRTNRPSGSSAGRDNIGAAVLISFKGLGSVGSSAR
ncbi:MAG: LPS assembly protein LptD [Mariprofundaceae bacterium]|nr:LPS assembly protein LptD [Mariprofundaceae bacterium]